MKKKYILSDGFVKAIIDPVTAYTGYHLNFGDGVEEPKQIKQCYWYQTDSLPGDNYTLEAAYINLIDD